MWPLATYRIQLNYCFNFDHLKATIAYLKKLGISHVYLSPVMQAMPYSLHGYNGIDFSVVNNELGGEKKFTELVQLLKENDMNILLDIVPNHMAASPLNKYWNSVLNEKKSSPFSEYFDICWSESTKNKLRYRRFFDINELVCMLVEKRKVFNHTHEFIFNLIRRNFIQGLRIDHIDGLRNPVKYFKDIRARTSKDFYIIVEKILAFGEILPKKWQLQGTTGYDFLNYSNLIFVNYPGLNKLIKDYQELTNHCYDLSEVIYEKNIFVIKTLFSEELRYLVKRLADVPLLNVNKIKKSQLKKWLLALSASMPVYRTYIQGNQSTSRIDFQIIKNILNAVKMKYPSDTSELCFFTQLFNQDVIKSNNNIQQWIEDWQVFTGPMMAKGFEDTTCYNYNALLSLNEVGSGLEFYSHAGDINVFHHYNKTKQTHYPYSLNATSTHDTKRSEDARARLNVLTEIPISWNKHLKKWISLNAIKKKKLLKMSVPDINEEIQIYQTLLSIWPLRKNEIVEVKNRLHLFLVKSLREAKVHSFWFKPNERYEQYVQSFCDTILIEEANNLFLQDFYSFQNKIAFYGMLNSLSQIALKILCPGIPDFYQGNELFRFDMVDPDNRRMILFEENKNLLHTLLKNIEQDKITYLKSLIKFWKDNKIKLFLIYELLKIRKDTNMLFNQGDYVALKTYGKNKDNIVVFSKIYKKQFLIVCVPRWYTQLCKAPQFPVGEEIWQNTYVELPKDFPTTYFSLICKNSLNSNINKLYLSKIFEIFPINVCISDN